MSRIGKKPIPVPAGVAVDIKGGEVKVKGPKGELARTINPDMKLEVVDGELHVIRPTDMRHHRALHGLTRALVSNMVVGVSEGFKKVLRIIGTGYRAEMQGENLLLTLGYSHDILVAPPAGIKFEVEDKGATIVITSYDKEMLGQVAADIRKLRPPEPYKGKGIRYDGEYVRQKAGKAGKTK